MNTLMESPIPTLPYSQLASFYDGMMEHVDYGKWARYIDKIFKYYDASIRTVCELACGTGSLAILLSKLGYQMTCSDISPDMIQWAETKAKRAKAEIDLAVSDMLGFKSDKIFDAVICLYDSVNYLPGKNDFRKLLTNVRPLIKDAGLFIFDVCTELNSLENFNQRYEHDKQHGYKRRSYYMPDQRIQVNDIEMTINGNIFHERHCQNIYRLSDITEEINKSPFRIVNMFENLTFKQGSEKAERVHFILQKD
jgi:SAM-dependent methyltransferase